METDKSKDIEALLKVDDSAADEQPQRLDRVLRRVRASVGQKDSFLFAIVKFWTVIAEMVAPIFAQLAARQAAHQANPAKLKADQSNPQTPEE